VPWSPASMPLLLLLPLLLAFVVMPCELVRRNERVAPPCCPLAEWSGVERPAKGSHVLPFTPLRAETGKSTGERGAREECKLCFHTQQHRVEHTRLGASPPSCLALPRISKRTRRRGRTASPKEALKRETEPPSLLPLLPRLPCLFASPTAFPFPLLTRAAAERKKQRQPAKDSGGQLLATRT
jgi:hypothetical protein